MKYMLMMHAPQGKGDWQASDWSPEALKAHIDFMFTLNKDLAGAGELVAAEGLAGPGEARIVRATSGGAPAVTDGPFPEAKEFLAGYWIVDCDSAQRAYAIAARVSSGAHLLEMAGDHAGAIERYRAAAARTTSVPERNYLTAQAARLAAPASPAGG